MNKGITLLLLLVVLCAMGLVLYFHAGTGKPVVAEPVKTPPTLAAQAAPSLPNPLQAPQGGSAGLRSLEPPIGSTPEGAPRPITLKPNGEQASPSNGVSSATPSARPTPQEPQTPDTPPKKTTATQPSQPDKKPDAQAGKPAQSTPPTDTKPKTTDPKPASGAPGLTPWETPPKKTDAQTTGQTNSKTPAGASAQSLSDKGSHNLRKIGLENSGKSVRLRIDADSPFPCKTFVLTGPDRLVIDLPGTWKGVTAPAIPQNTLVKNIRVGQQPAGPRLVLDLKGALKKHSIERSGNTVVIVAQ